MWFYDEKSNNLKYEIIKPNLNNIHVNLTDNNKYKRFRIINYVKNKDIFIMHAICSSHYLLFYKIDEENKTLEDILSFSVPYNFGERWYFIRKDY